MSSQSPNSEESLQDISGSVFEKTGDIPQAIKQDAEVITEKGNVITKDGLVLNAKNPNSDIITNPFEDPEVAEYFVGIYEKSTYECRHVFDPELTWTPEEEKKIVRKLDWRG
jgi:hypothetical protein